MEPSKEKDLDLMHNSTPFNASEYLTEDETVDSFLFETIEEGDIAELIEAIKEVAKATGVKKIAETTGLNRGNVNQIINSKTDPKLSTFIKMLNAMGLKMTISSVE
ncbi:putative addiction module antidote protein [Flammeovirga sp. MY04]|uniref:addiction module antidote protein n=1 Tax=Flammeovirga sp. MY04 TaxID=1191459 RepID=UPI0008061C5B|nr:addiction module antidote protein [Flammeovirga sp. MY04]ANQ49571.1 putative addiction module antidote protein [Flammeovirga sp. MY04]